MNFKNNCLQERLAYNLEKRVSPARSSCYSDTGSVRSSGDQLTPPSSVSNTRTFDRFDELLNFHKHMTAHIEVLFR